VCSSVKFVEGHHAIAVGGWVGVVTPQIVRAVGGQRPVYDAEIVIAIDKSQNEDVLHHLQIEEKSKSVVMQCSVAFVVSCSVSINAGYVIA